MATHNLFARANIGPGVLVSPWVTMDQAVKLLGRGRIALNITDLEYDDPTMILTLVIEYSTDGGATPVHLASQTMFGAHRNKAGQIPPLDFELSNVPDGALLRGILTLSKRLRTGLIGEL